MVPIMHVQPISSYSESKNLIFLGILVSVSGVTGLFLTLNGLRKCFGVLVDFFDGVVRFLEEMGIE